MPRLSVQALGTKLPASWRKKVHPQLRERQCRAAQPRPLRSTEPVHETADVEAEPSPYFDPLVRSFLLGVAFGGLLEGVVTLQQMASLADVAPSVWIPMAAHHPHFVQDHIFAFFAWVLIYVSESCNVTSMLAGGNAADLTAAGMRSLARVLLPLQLTPLKLLWMKSPYFKAGAAQAKYEVLPSEQSGSAVDDGAPPSVRLFRERFHTPAAASSLQGLVDNAAVKQPASRSREGLKPGQWHPEIGQVARVGVAKRSYLQDMFYCVALAPGDGLKDGTVHKTQLVGKEFAYWAGTNGKVQAISNTCVHRGAQLSLGWTDDVDGEVCLRCPYHAWAFAGDGTVRDIPVQPDGRYPRRPLQEALDVVLRGQKVWMYWGNPRVPRAERPPVPGYTGQELDLQSCAAVVPMDKPHHTAFEKLSKTAVIAHVAQALFGVSDSVISPLGAVERADFSLTRKYTVDVRRRLVASLPFPLCSPERLQVEVSLQLPSSVVMRFEADDRVVVFEAHVRPQAYEQSEVILEVQQNCVSYPGWTHLFRRRLEGLLEECMESGAPADSSAEVLPAMTLVESMSRSRNELQSRFYSLRDEFNMLGYGVPPEVAYEPNRSDF